MNVLEMTRGADERMIIFPRGKKKIAIAIAGAAIVLVPVLLVASSANSPDPISLLDQPKTGSDLKDLSGRRPVTGNSIRGTITINNQIPLPRGVVVAYTESMTRAVASSPIHRNGTYKLDNVPSFHLVLIVKPKLTDDANPEIAKYSNQSFSNPQNDGKRLRFGDKAQGERAKLGPPRFLNEKRPSEDALRRVKASVVTSDMEALPEVRWMIEHAFYKYNGSNPDVKNFVAPEGEGEKIFMMNLDVTDSRDQSSK